MAGVSDLKIDCLNDSSFANFDNKLPDKFSTRSIIPTQYTSLANDVLFHEDVKIYYLSS